MEKWNQLSIKDQIQYVIASVLVLSGIVIAFLSFFLNAFNIATGVLIYIAQAFVTAGGIFGVSIYFKSKIGEFETKADNKIIDVLPKDTEGCILVGKNTFKGGVFDSKETLERLLKKLDGQKEINITIE